MPIPLKRTEIGKAQLWCGSPKGVTLGKAGGGGHYEGHRGTCLILSGFRFLVWVVVTLLCSLFRTFLRRRLMHALWFKVMLLKSS